MDYEIIHGDSLTVLPTLKKGSVHTCVTSPAYFGLRDYQIPPTDWPAMSYAPMAGLPPLDVPAMTCCLGLEPTVEAYIGHLVLIFRGVREALRDDGTVWCNLGDSYASTPAGNTDATWTKKQASNAGSAERRTRSTIVGSLKPKDLIGVPWRFAFAMQADGWWLRQDIIWAKPNPMPESVTDRCTKAHEYIFLFTKSARYWYDHEAIKEPVKPETTRHVERYGGTLSLDKGVDKSRNDGETLDYFGGSGTRNRRSVWTVSTKPYTAAHFATFNPELIEPCILAGTSERGACPACSAGWARVVERTGAGNAENEIVPDYDVPGLVKGTPADRVRRLSGSTYQHVTRATNEWQPSCACDAGEPVPCLVLDIFAGTSATGEAALRNGRRYIGIEASAFNVQLSHDRLAPIDRERRGEFRPRHGEGEPLHELPLFAEANQ